MPLRDAGLNLPGENHLVFFTGGLVQSATGDIDQGLEQLTGALPKAVGPG